MMINMIDFDVVNDCVRNKLWSGFIDVIDVRALCVVRCALCVLLLFCILLMMRRRYLREGTIHCVSSFEEADVVCTHPPPEASNTVLEEAEIRQVSTVGFTLKIPEEKNFDSYVASYIYTPHYLYFYERYLLTQCP